MKMTNEVITLEENETITTDRIGAPEAQALALLAPHQLAIRPAWKQGSYELKAGAVIGTIIAGNVTVHIRPKVPVDNLFYMLTYAFNLPQFRSRQLLLDPNEALFEFIVRIFARQVDVIVRQGIQRGYIDHDEHHNFLRGRLLMGEHLRSHVVNAGRFYQRTNEFTADLLENRILHETLHQLSRIPYSSAAADLRPLVRRTAAAFAEVPTAGIRPSDCDRVLYTRLNERYRSPVNLARLLLQHLSLENRAGQMPFATFLLPMHAVFERFVAGYLTEALAPFPWLQVRAQASIRLDRTRRVTGFPDLIIDRHGREVAVLDTKYKKYGSKPGREDIYQMFTYAKALRVRQAMLIYPHDFAPDTALEMEGDVMIDMRPLSLAGSLGDFRASMQAFARQFAAEMLPAKSAVYD